MINKQRILAITLARGGSKSIKKKNIALINKNPLIYYTIVESLKSQYIDDYIISTDDDEIAQIAMSFGANIPFMRPKSLAQDRSTSADALFHEVQKMEELNNCKYDYVVEIMATKRRGEKKDTPEPPM